MPKKKLTDPFIRQVKVENRTDYYDTVCSGLCLRVSPKGSKSFNYRYNSGDKLKRITIGGYSNSLTLADARKEVAKIKADVLKGLDPQAERQALKNDSKSNNINSFSHVVENYKRDELVKKKDSTQKDYLNRINNHILPRFGDLAIKDIQRKDITQFLRDKAKTAPVQAQRIQAILSGIFNYAINEELTISNPAQSIKLINPKDYQRERDYSNEEIFKLWTAFEEQDEPVQSIFKMLLLCGQRSGETRKMKWTDVYEGTWTIPAENTKNKQRHYIPLPEMANALLENIRVLTGDSIFVFESPRKKNSPIEYIQYAAKRIRQISGIEDFRPHDLRHIVTTQLASMGTPEQVLSRLLNHGTVNNQVTRMYNQYTYLEEKRSALNSWCKKLQDILKGEGFRNKL